MAHPLALSPALRAWTRLGLDALLLESPQRADMLRLRPEASTPAQAPGRNAGAPPRPAARPNPGRDSASSGTARFAPATPPRAAREAQTPRPQPRDSAVPGRMSAPPAGEGRVLPPEAWPAAWTALRERRPLPPRPLVCWTYAGLGADLVGTPDPQRRELVARMIKGLNHPGGTHVFWPFELPEETPELAGDGAPSLFWSGEALLRTRALLVMGSDARDALGLPKIGPYCQTRVQGRLFIQLPQPRSLAEKPEAFGQAMAFLSGLLRFCATVRR